MKKSRFTEEQIAFALRQPEAGTPIVEVCRNMCVAELRRLKQLEEENRKLKTLVADPIQSNLDSVIPPDAEGSSSTADTR
jgi:putative transposase